MRVMVAEDSALLREGLVRMLADEGHDVIASVGDADALLDAVEENRPDIVVTDVRMPPDHTDEGLRAALTIRTRWPDVAVLVLSQHVETRYAGELISGSDGKVGYLLKDRVVEIDEFLDALNRVADGGTVFDPEVVRQLLSRTSKSNPVDRLTPRERDVLELMARGFTNARISADLFISVSSAEKHINSIFEKLGLSNSAGLSRRVMAVVTYLRS
ncbi:MAG: response regulator transcription factor [Rhodococcus fascians]|uniref:response regulator transcription factor n=1 Tax=Nocardiaceae TaxID=85025 RepID=UPI00037219A6|nr:MULTISPECIES: response regulator transcription factor [Rhodococcus]OZD05380.1 DNA-binding response regulator [Rhodococcus sp. 06-156-4C]OZD16490.1 DNA-binding response regulator [Rhodococcus sp. 06-156-4a]OZD26349.1 DNA-binding response regulator [Rhodococcus sp. 06-156-3C]OZD31744.1 DNA-binding response regulator [Rhodococcus sp. 06-156-3b]OZD35043.1 DNA-binding response regulator [Rhodococcus sp. 06-156-3]